MKKKDIGMKLRIPFKIILTEMIEKVDNGYNALVGNREMANEYVEKLIREYRKNKEVV